MIQYIDAFALAALWWTAFAAVDGGHSVDSWGRLTLAVALIGLQVFSAIGAIAVLTAPVSLPWWTRGLIYSGTVFAAWFYDRRFGIARHARMTWGFFSAYWGAWTEGHWRPTR